MPRRSVTTFTWRQKNWTRTWSLRNKIRWRRVFDVLCFVSCKLLLQQITDNYFCVDEENILGYLKQTIGELDDADDDDDDDGSSALQLFQTILLEKARIMWASACARFFTQNAVVNYCFLSPAGWRSCAVNSKLGENLRPIGPQSVLVTIWVHTCIITVLKFVVLFICIKLRLLAR